MYGFTSIDHLNKKILNLMEMCSRLNVEYRADT